MKTFKAGWLFAGGALFGLSIALCVGAGTKTNTPPKAPPMAAPTEAQKYAWAHIKLVGYPNGGTGFFDEETGIIYVYDAQLRHCYLMRQVKVLGDPMQPVN
ncbi:MAG: hypothetical protein MUF81_09095 [Verrucomicrobia bacterium]|jgi:hypothetical protein|nr:hypothetical protein [Verrucomicrobiota bacterium]